MSSFLSTFVFAASIVSMVSSQTIDPNSVDLGTRQSWCTSQKASCPELCLQINATSATSNTCDAATLDYSCVCSNGLTPNASEFSLTIPFFECTEFDNQCVAACGSDSGCASACREDHPCGAQNPVRINTTTTSTVATATGKSSASPTVETGFGGITSPASSNQNAGKLVFDVGASYGLAIVLTGVFAGFALL